ncbi:TPA: ATP-dependent DNA helicase RecQ [Escherichia coli]|nr:ATP-dependent DNA helicase RecQ [Escherichia coli]
MEFQWRQLRELLAMDECQDNNFVIHQDDGQFFYRLWRCLNDAGAGISDRLHGYYDALQCARAHGLLPLRLPLKERILSEDLLRAGLRRSRDYPGEVLLDENALQIAPELLAVWRKEKRRLLQTPPLDTLLPILLNDTKYTHYTSVGQQLAVRTVLTSDKDRFLFINLPTGAGKTFIIHSLMLATPASQLTLVIVPTISLAIEQAQRAQSMLLQANADHGGEYTWHSGQTPEAREAIKARIKAGKQRLLFCSPEAASSGSLLLLLFSLAKRKMIGALVVDEAHLIDQWGAEFRPEFQLLAPLVKSLVEVSKASIRTVLLSATWSQATLNTLKELFAGDNPQAIVEVNGSFLRPEPMWYVSKADDREDHRRQVEDAISTLPRPLILYVTTVEDAIDWHQYLLKAGYKRCGLVHGKVSPRQREKQIADWAEDNVDIMVATSAFGVGMDKNNVRAVLHVTVPENIDRLYQESGRGGRDGYASVAQLIYRDDQISLARHLNRDNLIGAKKGFLRWQKMHQNRESESPGYFSVYLDTKHDSIKIDSRANVAWNWRTLLMLQRAGLRTLITNEPKESLLEGTRGQPFLLSITALLAQDNFAFIGKSTLTKESVTGGVGPLLKDSNNEGVRRQINLSNEATTFLEFAFFLGFVEPFMDGYLVDPTRAIEGVLDRVLENHSNLPAIDFISRLAEVLPMIDGGSYRQQVEPMITADNWTPKEPLHLSASLSQALVRLELALKIKFEIRADDHQALLLTGPDGNTQRISAISPGELLK